MVGAPNSTTARHRYLIDAKASRFTIQAFAGGLLSALGHDPKFEPRDFTGEVVFDPDAPDQAALTMRMSAPSLTLVDDVSDDDRRSIERTMHHDVLEEATFPEIMYRCPKAAARRKSGQFEVALNGELTLHGVTRPQTIIATLSATDTTVRAVGKFTVLQSNFGIKPVSVAGSMLKVKDQLTCSFDITARR